jgi:cobalamin biosynthesis Mg chelatase CobN
MEDVYSTDYGLSFNWAENPTLQLAGGTLSPELPPADYSVSARDFGVSTGLASAGDFFSGLLNTAKSTAGTLLDAWGTVNAFQAQKDQMSLQRQIAAGQISVAQSQAESAAEIAKVKATSSAVIEKARADAAMAEAQNQAVSARTGNVYIPGELNTKVVLLGVAGVAGAIYFLRRKKG